MALPEVDPSTRAVVYIVHSGAGDLLYVGVTGDLRRRMYVHKCKSAWWAADIEITVESFASRVEADAREVDLIKALKPPHNHPRGVAIWISGDLRRAAESAAALEGISGQEFAERAVRREVERAARLLSRS